MLRHAYCSSAYATSTTATSSSFDPQTVQAQDALDEGSTALENGDLEGAQESYTRSLGIKETAIGALFLS